MDIHLIFVIILHTLLFKIVSKMYIYSTEMRNLKFCHKTELFSADVCVAPVRYTHTVGMDVTYRLAHV